MPDHSHNRWLGMAALAAADVLPADEVPAFEAHLASCGRCQTELGELRAVTGALNEVAMGEQMPDPPPSLGDGVVWAVRRGRRSQRLHRRVVSSVAAAAAAIALIGIGLAIPGPTGPPQEALAVAAASDAVDAKASLVAHTWGTEVKFVISGLEDGKRYRVTFIDHDGDRVSAGTFIGVADRPVVCDMNAAVLRPDAARLEVESAAGDVVVAADLPPS